MVRLKATGLDVLVAALEDVAEAAVRAIDRGSFETCDNEPECRDEAEPLEESQWCPSCRADAEIKAALLIVERVRAATGLDPCRCGGPPHATWCTEEPGDG